MGEFVNTIDIFGDDSLIDMLIDRTIVEYADDTVTSIGTGAFMGCSALTTVNLPVATSIGNNAFQNCSKLTTVDFTAATSVGRSVFDSCSALTELLLRNTEKVATLSHINAFSTTPIESGTGYIYVPRTMADGSDGVEAYKAASNWRTYAAQFRALEDYTVDGTITGALDPTKI